jgi:serine/threonine-protein phosphatase 2A activator
VLETLAGWVDDIPPLQQAMRYGNQAFRTWHSRLVSDAATLCRGLLPPEHAGAEVELAPYLCDAFGNATRIDYGTGHEASFVVFLCAKG